MPYTMADKLKVSRVTSRDELREYVMVYTEKMIGSVGKMDEELNWAAGPKGAGFFVGELDGERITGIVMMQHSDSYGWVALYYCEEKYRGKGFAFKTWKTARAAIDPRVNLGLDAVPSAAHLYERTGFKRAWALSFYNFNVSAILEAYNSMTTDGISTKLATQIDFTELRLYTEDVLGITFAQAGLLEKYITLPTHTAVVAVSGSGNVVGFAAIRECVNCEEKGYRLAPVLADTGGIARLLLLELAKTVHLNQKFCIVVLHGINPEAKKIVDEVKGEKIVDLVRMYTGGEQPIKKEKYFGEFSPELVG